MIGQHAGLLETQITCDTHPFVVEIRNSNDCVIDTLRFMTYQKCRDFVLNYKNQWFQERYLKTYVQMEIIVSEEIYV